METKFDVRLEAGRTTVAGTRIAKGWRDWILLMSLRQRRFLVFCCQTRLAGALTNTLH